MKILYNKGKIPFYFSLLICVFLFACSNDEQVSDTSDISAQTLRVGNGTEPESLDPHVTTGLPEYYIEQPLFEGLVSKNPQTPEPVHRVAESW